MSELLSTADGKYLILVDDATDGNTVVYRKDTMTPLWDRLSHEATAEPPIVPPGPTQPAPPPPISLPSGPGGFVEHASSTLVRPRFTRAQYQQFVPPRRGPFSFPAPYLTEAIKVTCEDEMILPVGYSYWPIINNHRGSMSMLVFVGHVSNSPRFFRIDKKSGTVTSLGSLTSYTGTGEGWRWSSQPGSQLYLHDGPRLRCVDVVNGTDEIIFDISNSYPDCIIWQHHSSDDGQTHSATVRRIVANGQYPDVGIVVYRDKRIVPILIHKGYDECQLDKSGVWLIVKEGVGPNGATGIDNRIINLVTGEERVIRDADGAVGHSDTGTGSVIGEDDQHEPCAMVRWRLDQPLSRELMYWLPDWDGGLGHVSVRNHTYLVSNVSHQDSRRNEMVVPHADGSGNITIVAPNMMVLPGGTISYENQVQASLDPLGEYYAWTANPLGRLDLFVGRL